MIAELDYGCNIISCSQNIAAAPFLSENRSLIVIVSLHVAKYWQLTYMVFYIIYLCVVQQTLFLHFSGGCAKFACCWSETRNICYRPNVGKLEICVLHHR